MFFNICFISVYSVLNTLSEYTYFHISKTLLHKFFLLVFKILENPKAYSVSYLKNFSKTICTYHGFFVNHYNNKSKINYSRNLNAKIIEFFLRLREA